MNNQEKVTVTSISFRFLNQMFVCFIASWILFSCNESSNNKNSIEPDTSSTNRSNNNNDKQKEDDKADIQNLSGNCYAINKKGSTAFLSLNINNGSVTGNLEYRLKEKDTNTGTIKGYIKGDRIYTFYNFQSEGMTSVREEIFKIEGDRLLIAIGESDIRNDTVVFRSKDNLRFDEAFPFAKTSCK